MYLGIDFLINPALEASVVEVNVGLPGGAEEYDRTHLVYLHHPSDVFFRIEEISERVYKRPFKDYLDSLPFIESLKILKVWMDGQGPFPAALHPGLRLEDKWVQYQILSPLVPMPETMVFDPRKLDEAGNFLGRRGRLVLKSRLGRGGRHFRIVDDYPSLEAVSEDPNQFILQEYIDSRVDDFVFSIRSVAFAGEHVCLYANLSRRAYSNHGTLAYVLGGDKAGLADREFKTTVFDRRSWEADIWFGETEPAYLHHNLYEDEVARTALVLPDHVLDTIRALSVRIERFYDGLDSNSLPQACFEADTAGTI
jgi:hypothetical protein